MHAQLKPIAARLRHRLSQTAKPAERAVLGALILGLVWIAAINLWSGVSLAQESSTPQNQGNPGQVQVCKYDAELDGLLCGEWVDIDTLPVTDVPELNCPYGIYWDKDAGRFRCKPRCYYIVLIGWFCHTPVTPVPSPTPSPTPTPTPTPTPSPTPTPTPTPTPSPTPTPTPGTGDEDKPDCTCGEATKVNGKWKCPDRPAKPANCTYGTTWSNCKWQCKPRPTPPTPVLSVTAGNDIAEGDSATFTITANPAPKSTLTAKITVSQSGDYAVSGTTGSKTVTIPTSGSTTYNVKTEDDSVDEPNGSITLTLNTGSGYTVHATDNTATVNVADNDDPPTLTAPTGLKLTPIKDGLELTYDRDVSGERIFRFDLYHATTNPGDVSGKKIALGDTAYHTRRFLHEDVSHTATFKNLPVGWYYAVGRTCRSDKTNAVCGSAHAISNVAMPNKAFLIPPTKTLLAEPAEKADERDVSFRLVYPGGAPSGGAKVQLTFGGPAVHRTDYSFLGPQITFAAGEREKTLPLRVLSDSLPEADERIGIAITGIEGDPNMGHASKKHELVITDLDAPLLLLDDAPKELIFNISGSGPHRLRLRLQTSWNKPIVLPDYEFDNRSFTLQAESYLDGKPAESAVTRIAALRTVNASHDSDTALYGPGDARVVPATGNLRDYDEPSTGHAYWREGDQPYDHRYLEVVLSPGKDLEGNRHDRYRLTFTKPDFAITAPPKLAQDAKGNYRMTLSLYNAESYSSERRDPIVRIKTFCHQRPVTVSEPAEFTLSDLREPGDTYLLAGQKERTLSFPVLCPRGAYPASGQVLAVAQVSEGQYQGPVLYGVADFKGPERDDTLWAPQTKADLSGGLALVTPQSCTLSFVLPLQRNGKSPVPAASTTGHCADDENGNALFGSWQQGTKLAEDTEDTKSPNSFLGSTELHPLKSPGNELPSSRAKCPIYLTQITYEEFGPCRRGDQSYATIDRSASGIGTYKLPAGKNPYPKPVTNSYIAKPKTQNRTGEQKLEIGYFKIGSKSFEIVGARPPRAGDKLYKVGVTTGWTEGELANIENPDGTCPGGKIGKSDNMHAGTYHECRSEATYASLGGDSGAPVFVEKPIQTTPGVTEVLLVGVHWGGELPGASREFSRFIPIDRIYAEALIIGYDWDADWLRPLPQLDERGESLTINRSAGTARAVFDRTDFSRSRALVYEVGLYQRKDGKWGTRPIAIDQVTYRDPVAEFTGLTIPEDSKGADWRVRVRMNAKLTTGTAALDRLDHRGGWGPASTITARIVSYPEKLALSTPTGLHQGQTGTVRVAATRLAPESDYRLELSSKNQNAAFDTGCSVFEMQTDLPEKASSYQKDVELHGCKPGPLEVEADLERGNLPVAADSESGTVRKLPAAKLTGLSETLPRTAVREITVNVANLDPAGGYRLQLTASKGSGLGTGCTAQTAAVDIATGAKSYAGKFSLNACTAGDHTLTVALSHNGKELASRQHKFKVLDQVLTLGDLPPSVTAGQELALSAQVKNLDPKSSYQLSVKADGKVAGFGGTCVASRVLMVPAGSDSFGGALRLKACAAGQADLTVALLSAGSVVKSVTGKVAVVAAPSAKPSGAVFMSGLPGLARVGQSISFAVKASQLSSAHAYTVRIELSGARVGFDSSCQQQSREIAIPAGAKSFDSGEVGLHVCGKGLADVTVRLLSSGNTVATDFRDVAVLG